MWRGQCRQRHRLLLSILSRPAPLTVSDVGAREMLAERAHAGHVFMSSDLPHRRRQRRTAQHSGFSGAENTSLFSTDEVKVIPQVVDMVNANRRNHPHIGIKQVHRIKAAPQPHFQHDDIQRRLLKDKRGGKRAHFKVAQANHVAPRLGASGLDTLKGIYQRAVSYRLTVNGHPFTVAAQMRRGVGTAV